MPFFPFDRRLRAGEGFYSCVSRGCDGRDAQGGEKFLIHRGCASRHRGPPSPTGEGLLQRFFRCQAFCKASSFAHFAFCPPNRLLLPFFDLFHVKRCTQGGVTTFYIPNISLPTDMFHVKRVGCFMFLQKSARKMCAYSCKDGEDML